MIVSITKELFLGLIVTLLHLKEQKKHNWMLSARAVLFVFVIYALDFVILNVLEVSEWFNQ